MFPLKPHPLAPKGRCRTFFRKVGIAATVGVATAMVPTALDALTVDLEAANGGSTMGEEFVEEICSGHRNRRKGTKKRRHGRKGKRGRGRGKKYRVLRRYSKRPDFLQSAPPADSTEQQPAGTADTAATPTAPAPAVPGAGVLGPLGAGVLAGNALQAGAVANPDQALPNAMLMAALGENGMDPTMLAMMGGTNGMAGRWTQCEDYYTENEVEATTARQQCKKYAAAVKNRGILYQSDPKLLNDHLRRWKKTFILMLARPWNCKDFVVSREGCKIAGVNETMMQLGNVDFRSMINMNSDGYKNFINSIGNALYNKEAFEEAANNFYANLGKLQNAQGIAQWLGFGEDEKLNLDKAKSDKMKENIKIFKNPLLQYDEAECKNNMVTIAKAWRLNPQEAMLNPKQTWDKVITTLVDYLMKKDYKVRRRPWLVPEGKTDKTITKDIIDPEEKLLAFDELAHREAKMIEEARAAGEAAANEKIKELTTTVLKLQSSQAAERAPAQGTTQPTASQQTAPQTNVPAGDQSAPPQSDVPTQQSTTPQSTVSKPPNTNAPQSSSVAPQRSQPPAAGG